LGGTLDEPQQQLDRADKPAAGGRLRRQEVSIPEVGRHLDRPGLVLGVVLREGKSASELLTWRRERVAGEKQSGRRHDDQLDGNDAYPGVTLPPALVVGAVDVHSSSVGKAGRDAWRGHVLSLRNSLAVLTGLGRGVAYPWHGFDARTDVGGRRTVRRCRVAVPSQFNTCCEKPATDATRHVKPAPRASRGADVPRVNGVEQRSRPRSGTRRDRLAKLACSVGIMAHNEAANMGPLLEALLEQDLRTCELREILVLSSGSTDDTEAIVRRYSARDRRIRLLRQASRKGKASAVNLFLRHAHTDIVVLESADTLPEPTTLERMVAPFANPEVGMTGGRPVPVNDSQTFMGFAAHLLWNMHHRIALRQPKMGELIAFRRIFQRIPYDSAVDEASIEPLIHGQGFQLRYVPDAILYTRGPQTPADFVRQRRRIQAGHLRMRHRQGYVVSTLRGRNLMRAFLACWRWDWRHVLWSPGVVALEMYARLLGSIDYWLGPEHRHTVWEIAATTKGTLR
jgi:poly-beta-1,6-N-acetyl-D-glucosamine synthase